MTREQMILDVQARDEDVAALKTQLDGVNASLEKLKTSSAASRWAAQDLEKMGQAGKRAGQQISSSSDKATADVKQVGQAALASASEIRTMGTAASTAASQTEAAAGRMSRAWGSASAAWGKYSKLLGEGGSIAGGLLLASGVASKGGYLGTIASGALSGSYFGPYGIAAGAVAGTAYAGVKDAQANQVRLIGHTPDGDEVYEDPKTGRRFTKKGGLIAGAVRLGAEVDPFVAKGHSGFSSYTGPLVPVNTRAPNYKIDDKGVTGAPHMGDRPGERGQRLTRPELVGTKGPRTDLTIDLQRRIAKASGTATDVDDLSTAREALAQTEKMLKDADQLPADLVRLEGQKSGLLNQIRGILSTRDANDDRTREQNERDADARERKQTQLSQKAQQRLARARSTTGTRTDDVSAIKAAIKETEDKIQTGKFAGEALTRLENLRASLEQQLANARRKQGKSPILDIDEISDPIRIKIAKAEATPGLADNVTAVKAALKQINDRIENGKHTVAELRGLYEKRAVIVGELNALRAKIAANRKKEKAEAGKELDAYDDATQAYRDERDARDALSQAMRIGDPTMIQAAKDDLQDSLLERAKLRKKGITFDRPGGPPSLPVSSKRAMAALDPSMLAALGGSGIGTRVKLAQSAAHPSAIPVSAGGDPLDGLTLNVYIGEENITPHVRKELNRTSRRNTTPTRGRHAGKNALR
jgi:hypothetical protein